MIVSLNELESSVRKAFRGAGYHWGEAEDAGKAAAWLARRGVPLLPPLLRLLHEAQSHLPEMRPLMESGAIHAAGGILCPVLAGITLSDSADALQAGQTLRFGRLRSPVLLAPFLAAAAEAVPLRLVFSTHAGTLEAMGRTCSMDIPPSTHDADAAVLRVHAGSPLSANAMPVTEQQAAVDPAQWETLCGFGARTHVPATAKSRLSGAGAGVHDAD